MLNSLRTGLNLHRLILLLAFSATLITFLNSYYSSYQVQKQQLINETLNNHKAYAAKLVSATDNFLLAAQQQLANMRSGGALLPGAPRQASDGTDSDDDSESRPGTYL